MTTTVPEVADLIPEQPETAAFRTWRRGTGRCLGVAGDIAWSGSERASLPFQRLAVVDVKIRSSAESKVSTSFGDHVPAALEAASKALGLGTLEAVVSGRCDVPLPVGDRASAEAGAVILAVAAAAGAEASEDFVAGLLAELGHNPAVARRGVFVLDSASGGVRSDTSWEPYFSLLVVHPAAHESYEPVLVGTEGVREAYQAKSLEALAALATQNALGAYPEGSHPVLDGVRSLDLGEDSPLGFAVSSQGPAVTLLYPATKEGRAQTLAACRKLAGAGLSFKFVVSLTPKPA